MFSVQNIIYLHVSIVITIIYEREYENVNGRVNIFVKRQAVVNASLMALT
jgi:hypothetical protein